MSYIIAITGDKYWTGFGWSNLKRHAERFTKEGEAERQTRELQASEKLPIFILELPKPLKKRR